jgi:hypothetical protein
MMRDARKHGLFEKDYFADLEWPGIATPKPDPFTAEERDKILKLKKLFGGETETLAETPRTGDGLKEAQVAKKYGRKKWSGRVDLNHRLHGPEPCALPS